MVKPVGQLLGISHLHVSTKELCVKFSAHGLTSKWVALAGLSGMGLTPQMATAIAPPLPTWEYTVLARASVNALSDPALDRNATTELWQVAFSSRGGQWLQGPQDYFPPGIHFFELGGLRKTLVKPGDPIPATKDSQFCFLSVLTTCNGGAPFPGPLPDQVEQVSLSQGEVAFAGGSDRSASSPVQGIYTVNGQRGLARIADTSMAMPDFGPAPFGSFNAPSLSLGRVVFRASSADAANPQPAMEGIYGNFDGLTTVRVVDKNSLGLEHISAFRSFAPYASVARSRFEGDRFAVAFGATARARNDPNKLVNGAFMSSVWGGVPGFLKSVADTLGGFGMIEEPAVAFLDQVAFYAASGSHDTPAGIYARDEAGGFFGNKAVATVGTAIPGESGTFLGGFGSYPSIDMDSGQAGSDRWIGFTVSGAAQGKGVYLSHEWTKPDEAAALERVVDEAGIFRLLAPYLGMPAGEQPLLRFSLFHQAAKKGAVAFRVNVGNYEDFIVLARKTVPTLTLKADADTYVRADLNIRRNDNYGMQDFVEVGTGRADAGQSEGDPDKMRAFLHFNTAILPKLALSSASVEMTLHSYDNGQPDSVFSVDAHAISAAWTTNKDEGNGFEGDRPPGAPAALTDPDSAWGVAWAGAGLNPDPFALNNSTQPNFKPEVLASQTLRRQTDVPGARFQWDVTELAKSWLNAPASNFGVALTDASSAGDFRGLRFGSREGESLALPSAVAGPRLALKWMIGAQPGDFTGNGCVDRDDMSILLAVIRGQAEAGESLTAAMDLNVDGKLDIADSRKLATLFTKPLGAACN
jgi:hypothetical protein